MLAKCLHPLPEKWHGLVDVEARYRQRYLDLLVNADARAHRARARSRASPRCAPSSTARDFLEVETPVLQPLYGGAAARPFVTHYDVYDQDVYLRISDELYLKRLVIGGLDRVYEIGHNFRNEGVSRKHNPEFTMMECYQAYADYRDMMELVQAMLQHVVRAVTGGTRVTLPRAGDRVRRRVAARSRSATASASAPASTSSPPRDFAALRARVIGEGPRRRRRADLGPARRRALQRARRADAACSRPS